MKAFDKFKLVLIFLPAILTSCLSNQHVKSSTKVTTVTNGYSCFVEEINPVGAKSNYYLCVFSLNQASSYYDESARTNRINSFIKTLGGKCHIGKTKEMVDPKNQINHSLVLMATSIICDQ